MSELSKPFPAYEGDEPFVFVCYAHNDAKTVYADLRELDERGINLWYDEGIGAGKSWRAEIADAIQNATHLLFFISKSSLVSAHCLREVDYALHNEIDIVPVYLDDAQLPGELALVLNRVQALFRKTDGRYIEHLVAALRGAPQTARFGTARKSRRKPLWLIATAAVVVIVAGVLWMQAGQAPENTAVNAAPNAFDFYLEGLELLERWDKEQNLDRAIGLFRKAAAADPEFALAFARLADGLRIRYALTGDEALLEEATSLAEEALRLDDRLAPVHIVLSKVHAMHGNNDLAFAAVERALEIDANDAMANLAMASMLAKRGKTDDAEAAFKRAVALDPENIRVLSGFANFLFDQTRLNEAVTQWQGLLRLAPDHYPTLVNLGSALTELNRMPEAITMFEQAIAIEPTYMAWSNLGTAYSRAGRLEDAVEAYRNALQIDDSDWLAWGNLAYVLSWSAPDSAEADEAFAKAIELAEKARRQDPRDAWVNSDLALYYAKTGQPGLARQRLETAVALAPDTGEILAAAAEAWEVMGERDNAIDLARQALAAGYTQQQLRRNAELAELVEDPRMAE
jgi:tetratricopeptide (TPR) repeat protein